MEDKIITETDTIKAVREEFEKQIKEANERHLKALDAVEKKHIEQIKVLLSGRDETLIVEKDNIKEEKEKTREEVQIEKLRTKFRLTKGGK